MSAEGIISYLKTPGQKSCICFSLGVTLLLNSLGAEWQEATELMKVLGMLLRKLHGGKTVKQERAPGCDGAVGFGPAMREQIGVQQRRYQVSVRSSC